MGRTEVEFKVFVVVVFKKQKTKKRFSALPIFLLVFVPELGTANIIHQDQMSINLLD